MALMTTAESFTDPKLWVEPAEVDADNPSLADFVPLGLLRAGFAFTTSTESGATSGSCVPLASISEGGAEMEPEALLVSVSCFAPVHLFFGRRCRCRTFAVRGDRRVASPRDAPGVERGPNGSKPPPTMRTKTRSQGSAANVRRRDHEVAARCADLQPTLPSRLEHDMALFGYQTNNNGSHVNTSLGQVLSVRALDGMQSVRM